MSTPETKKPISFHPGCGHPEFGDPVREHAFCGICGAPQPVYILFRNDPHTGHEVIAAIVTEEKTMRLFLNEDTTECRSVQQWAVNMSSTSTPAKLGEWSNGESEA